MHFVKVEPDKVRQLVDAFKSEGTFDKLRRKIFCTISATERYQNVVSNAEVIVDDLLEISAQDLTKNKARDILRKKLFGLYSSQYGIMIANGLDADETLCNLLEEIGHHVDSFFGLTKTGLLENAGSQQPNEDHEVRLFALIKILQQYRERVCDMEIDSDSEQSHQIAPAKETSLSDIALPPSTHSNANLSTVRSYPQTSVVAEIPFGSGVASSFRRNSSMTPVYARESATTRPMRVHHENTRIRTPLSSYQTQEIVMKKFCSNSKVPMPSSHYVKYRGKRRRKTYNDDFVYY